MGYVGLPLSILIAKKSFRVFGFDHDKEKIKNLINKKSYIKHISQNDLATVVNKKKFYPTGRFELLGDMDVIIICVPTPLSSSKRPDLKYVKKATVEIISKIKNISPLIILESTTYPGTSKQLLSSLMFRSI